MSFEATFHRVTVKQEDVLLREPHLIRAQMEERSKPLTANAENTNHETEKTPEDSSTKRWSSTVKESSSVEEKKDDREGNDPSSPFRKKETTDKQKPIAENVQNTKLVVEEPFTSKSSSTTQGSSQSSTTTEGLSTNIGPNYVQDSLARKKEDKGSSFPTSKKEDIQDKLKPITDNVPNTELVVEETFTSKGSSTARGFSQSSVTTEGLSTNKGFDSTIEKKDKDSSSLMNKNKVDTPQPVTENVQNTTPMIDESSTSKVSSKARGSSQSFATTEGLSTTKGSDGNEASLAREKEDKDSSSSMSKRKDDVAKPEERLVQEPLLVEDKETKDMPKSQLKDVEIKKPFVKESFALNNSSTNKDVLQTEKEDKVATSTYQKKVDGPEPVIKSVQNTIPVVEESSTLKGSSEMRSSSQARTKGLFAAKGSDGTEASLAREMKGKDFSSFTSQRKEDVAKPEKHSIQEPLLAEDKETKDKPKSQLRDIENTQPFGKESLASNDSSTSKDVLRTEKEDKVATTTYPKKAQVSKDVTKTDDNSVQEPLVTHKEAEDKPKIQLDTIEYKKHVVNESSEMPLTSTDPSPTEESSQREQKNKVSASAIENKEISKDMAISKDDPALKEPLHIRKEIKDKPKVQIDNVQSGKPVTQYKPSTEESTEANGSSNTTGIIRRKKQDKVLSSTSENKECNYAKGRWVFDSRRPLYSGLKCKRWLSWIFACRLTTRPDFHFEQFRWQPENCDMPEFERHSFLERMKNKTIAFVGDSIGRQQFQSFMCMLTGGDDTQEVEDVGPEYDIRPKNMAYRFPQTNTTIIYFWSSCLCDLTPMNTSNPDAGVAMHLDRPPAFLRENLHKFDVLVLNTGHHWNRGKIKVNKWVMHVDGKPNMDKTLFTVGSAKNFTIWSIVKWVDSQLKSHPRGLKAFFRTISPRHFFGGEWNTGGSCENTTPLVHGSQVTQNESSDELVANAVKGTGVRLLDITALSALRDEGHISKYGHKANSGVRDCLHWCLPGIPDTWNEILATQI